MKGSREDFEALVATSLYEALTPAERARLEAYLAERPEWRKEAEELQAFVQSIPAEPIPFAGDLRPVLRQRIAEEPRNVIEWGWWRRIAVPMAAGLAVALLAAYGYIAPRAEEEMRAEAPPVEATPAAHAIATALEAVERRAYAEAATQLARVVDAFPGDPAGGEAQRLLADLQFAALQRYDLAYDAYERLRRDYPRTWNSSAECAHRYDLLVEAKPRNFEALHALDAARDSADSFLHLERIVAENPNTTLAYEAIARMRSEVGALTADGGPMEVAALEMVRQRCTNPLAIAQLNMALGSRYERELSDIELARQHYAAAANTGDMAVASAARDALARLERAE